MTNVYIIEQDSKTSIEFIINGEDIIDQLFEATGDFKGYLEDGCETYYMMSEQQFDWWTQWVEVEEKVNEAWENATEEQREEHAKLVAEYGNDMETLHDMECELFGIEC